MFCILLFTVFVLQTEFAFSDDCETSWEKVGSKCLWKSSEKATHWENYRTCQQLGAAMVSPRTREENEELKRFIGNEPGWYSLSGYELVKKFIWIDGERITYSDWNSGQPNQLGSERGACIQINGVTGWDDDHCDNKYMQMCEKEINTENEEEKPKKCDDEDTKKYEELKQKLKDVKRRYKKREQNFENAKEEYEAEIKSMKNKITSQKKKIRDLQYSHGSHRSQNWD